MNNFWGKFVVVVGLVGMGLALVVLRLWAITLMWGWYVVPTFDVGPLSMVSAYGIALLLLFFKPEDDSDDRDKDFKAVCNEYSRSLIKGSMRCGWILLFGWAVISWWPL